METTMSPRPIKKDENGHTTPQPETMSFPEAVKEILAGKKIHKLEWEDKGYYGFLNGSLLSLHKPDGVNYQWVLNDGDLMGTDYIII